MNKIDSLLRYQKEVMDLQYVANILDWDLKMNCPEKSIQELIKKKALIEMKIFGMQKSDKYGLLLANCITSAEFDKLSEEEKRCIIKLFESYHKNKKVPTTFYEKHTKLCMEATDAWEKAVNNGNYETLKPFLKKVIDSTKKLYKYKTGSNNNLYDAMLNEYEEGMTAEVIDRLFSEIKDALLPIIKKTKKTNVKKVRISVNEETILKCAKYILNYIGFDETRGTVGIYKNAFTSKMNENDVRITFNKTNDLLNFATTVLHEGGHALFEQNVSEKINRIANTTLDNLFALSESQSRFYENMLGRNKNFWLPIFDEVKNTLNINTTLDEFIESLNTISSSPVRLNTDELSYCFHIIIRYEIERDLFNDKIGVEEIQKVWNEKMQEYLGIKPETDKDGLMQDVHWFEGSFGYFPSYLLGTIYDGMFLECIKNNLGNIDDILRSGNIKEITDYFSGNIYRFGGAYNSCEVIKRLCDKELSTKPIIEYYKNKYE